MRAMHTIIVPTVFALWKLKREIFEFQGPAEQVDQRLMEVFPLIPWDTRASSAIVSVEADVHSGDQWL